MTVDTESLKARFSYLIPLNKLPAERQSRLLAQSDVLELRKKDVLFRQGERDDYTFYVITGDLEMFADESLIKRVSGGEGASFQPLAQLQPRQMTAIAKTKVTVLRVRRSTLDQLLSMDDAPKATDIPTGVEVEEMESEKSGDWLMTLLQSELFTRIPPSNIQRLLDTVESVSVKAGDEVIKQGETGDYYFAIQNGTCEVVRKGTNKREIRLAELGPGDTFGEEALISGAKRNATVRMTADGELARLTKDDFTKLIKAPLLNVVTRAEAEQRVAAGARWLDVRFADEHGHNGLPGSINIPLGVLRTRMDELDPATRYVAYCDSGGRSSAAAFLLAEKGFEVCYVEGGAVDEPAAPAAKPSAPRRTAAKAAPAPTVATANTAVAAPAPAAARDNVLEAAARASSLGAEVEKANLTIEQAQKLMAEAEAMKAEAERFVAAKLERERARLAEEFAELTRKMAEAESLKNSLSDREQAAQAEAARQQAAAAARAAALEQELTARAQEREQRLAREAELVAEKLAQAERLQETLTRQHKDAELAQQAHARLQEDQSRVQRESALLNQKLAETEQLKESLARQQREAVVADTARQHLQEEQERIRHAAETLAQKLAEVDQLKETLARQERASESERATQARLKEQQNRIEREGALLNRKLADTEKLKQSLIAQQQAAELEVARQHDEVDQRLARLESDADLRLRQEQKRLETLYQQQAEQLESLQAGREAELREQLRKELAAERGKFEFAVAHATAELERAREERAAAIAAKEATAEEARRIIEEFKVQQHTLMAEQQALFANEREKLRAEAARIDQLRVEAARARKEAETIKEAAESELADARQRKTRASAAAAGVQIDTTIIEIEERANAATRELKQALDAEAAIATAAEEHEDELERTYNTATEINVMLQKELKEWVGDEDELRENTMQREILSRQKEMVDRIRARAAASKSQESEHTQSLLDEVQQQLGRRK